MENWYIGTIGFSYKDWVGEFYPIHTTQREYLPYYSKLFNCVELDTTFHAIPKTRTVQSWYSVTPQEFKFSIKTPRIITHELGLRGANGLMDEFLASVSPLQHKLGPILIQLPPKYDQSNISDLDVFLTSLPAGYQFAIEFRHPSWYNEQTYQLLNRFRVCWVSLDYPNIPNQINLTSNFIYIRWIGRNGLYQRHSFEREYKNAQLKSWLTRLIHIQDQVTDIFGFFNNDYTGCAAATCKRFRLLAGLVNDNHDLPYQERLF